MSHNLNISPNPVLTHELITAVKNDNLNEVDHLLKDVHLDPNIKDPVGDSLSRLASIEDNVDMVELLLYYGSHCV
jgi:hypothetical protein